MQSIVGTKTEVNLLKAFAGESQARNRYTYFASRAKKEGYQQIAAIFEETANQEKEHAERFFKFLGGGMVEITAPFPAGVIRSTAENLQEAANGEYDEWHNLYPHFAQIAAGEGFDIVADALTNICVAEKHHQERYLALLDNLKNDLVFKKPAPVVWRCRNCGYIHKGSEAPEVCPACAHLQEYFEVLAEKWN